MKRDYYEILGLPKDATLQQIKKKYRSLALKHHPDRVEEKDKTASEEKFKEISEAYGVLSDPKKKQMYGQYGHAGIDQNYTSDDIFKGTDFSSVFGGSGLGDIFSQFFSGSGGSDIFGGGGSRQRAQRGRDIQYEVNITLQEAHDGVKKKITIPRNEHCTECRGTGAKSGTAMKSCKTCGGQGRVMMSSGFFKMQQTCPECNGNGQIITEHCPQCRGKGHLRVIRKIDVNMPPGVDNSSRLRVSGEGEVSTGGAGDLYLYIHVLPHDFYQRDGNDIYIDLSIGFVQAALGGEISVPTLNGKVSMKIPASTQSGKMFRLKQKGMPSLRGEARGDLYAKVMIQVPEKLTGEQKKILEHFAKACGESVSSKGESKGESIKEKIKKVFE